MKFEWENWDFLPKPPNMSMNKELRWQCGFEMLEEANATLFSIIDLFFRQSDTVKGRCVDRTRAQRIDANSALFISEELS
jgi:hypothetical protein